jgi:hypothetical protein
VINNVPPGLRSAADLTTLGFGQRSNLLSSPNAVVDRTTSPISLGLGSPTVYRSSASSSAASTAVKMCLFMASSSLTVGGVGAGGVVWVQGVRAWRWNSAAAAAIASSSTDSYSPAVMPPEVSDSSPETGGPIACPTLKATVSRAMPAVQACDGSRRRARTVAAVGPAMKAAPKITADSRAAGRP